VRSSVGRISVKREYSDRGQTTAGLCESGICPRD
jgi:hypothetical protein